MGIKIACIPADDAGNKLFLKGFKIIYGEARVQYSSTYNDIPFTEVVLHLADGGANYTILGDDGTVLYRFSASWVNGLN